MQNINTATYDCNQLAIFHEAAKRSNYDFSVISGNEPTLLPCLRQSYLRKIFKILELIICHIDLGIEILKNKHKDAIIVHGFSTEFLFFTYISSLFYTKNIYILTHHNVQQAYHNSIVGFLFKTYHELKYKFIINENSMLLKNINLKEKHISNNLSLPHPVTKILPSDLQLSDKRAEALSTANDNKKKIGIIGKIRQEKQLDKTFNLLLNLQNELEFLIIVGTDNLLYFDQFNLSELGEDKILFLDTSTKKDYLKALELCDVIVLNYDKSKYYYRCSGVAADAIGTRTYVICPNFPMMSFQINNPTQVGLVYDYDDESSLEKTIRQGLQLIPSSENSAFDEHYTERSIQAISSVLVEDIESQIE